MTVQGTLERLKLALTDITGKPHDATGALSVLITRPDGTEETLTFAKAEVHHEGEAESGLYYADVETPLVGLYHFRWLDEGQVAFEGDFEVESKFAEGETPDLTDLKVLVPRARRKVEGPWGNPNGKPPLRDVEIYNMVADACSEIIMLAGKLFRHELKVKTRDPLGGFPTEWRTDTPLEEYEAAIICAQTGLDYYWHVFRTMKISQGVKNEGTEYTYSLSANVLRDYLASLISERDHAVAGLRANVPVLDRFASNIRVRDQATVAALEWWAGYFDSGVPGGLPGGQESAVIPVFFPPGIVSGY